MLIGIAAMTTDGVMGKDGKLPWHIPSDLNFFKNITYGKTLIMGRKTYENIPKMKGRKKIVVSSSLIATDPEVIVVPDIEALMPFLKTNETLFVIGGSTIYEQLIPLCDRFYLTKIETQYEGNVYFPIDTLMEYMQCKTERIHVDSTTKDRMEFEEYERKRK